MKYGGKDKGGSYLTSESHFLSLKFSNVLNMIGTPEQG